MTDMELELKELTGTQEMLQDKHDRAQASFQAARAKYAKAKDALVTFNTKYGRYLKMVVADPDAEEAPAEAEEPTAEAPETVEVPVVEDPAGDGPFEDPVDTSGDDTVAEE